MIKEKPSKLTLEKMYNEGLIQSEIGRIFGLSQSDISVLMKQYGIITKGNIFWSSEEEKILRQHYLKSSKGCLTPLLPYRGWGAIKNKALKMGLCRDAETYRHSREVVERLRILSQSKKIKINKNEKSALSYVLGVMDGDGYTDRKNTIGLETKFKQFAEKFSSNVKTLGMRPNMGIRKRENKHFMVWASSREFVEWYLELNFQKKLSWLVEIGDLAWRYVEGRYDSDGYLHPCGSQLICIHNSLQREFVANLLSKLGLKVSIQATNGVWVSRKSALDFATYVHSVYPYKNLEADSKI